MFHFFSHLTGSVFLFIFTKKLSSSLLEKQFEPSVALTISISSITFSSDPFSEQLSSFLNLWRITDYRITTTTIISLMSYILFLNCLHNERTIISLIILSLFLRSSIIMIRYMTVLIWLSSTTTTITIACVSWEREKNEWE